MGPPPTAKSYPSGPRRLNLIRPFHFVQMRFRVRQICSLKASVHCGQVFRLRGRSPDHACGKGVPLSALTPVGKSLNSYGPEFPTIGTYFNYDSTPSFFNFGVTKRKFDVFGTTKLRSR